MIEIRNISKTYDKGSKALKDIDIRIQDGEFVFIMGRSGSGKSTLIRLLLKEAEPTSGRIVVNDMDLQKMPRRYIPKYRRRLGVVFQDFRLLKDRTVFENVAFAQRVIGVPSRTIRETVPQMLRLVGLSSKYKAYPGQLSGGEQQRIAIARAILKNAPILILDEATAFADPDNEVRVQQALSALSKGKTVIMIAHRLSSIKDADCIYVLQNGEIVESGTHSRLIEKNGIFARMWKNYSEAAEWKIARR